mmetsp:Transcript_89850/g.217913  ORF Transcript_89850/g.217913 Transcript_89850/m.217913 type:complete len:97 (-) Transcript_89850:23-313(-)
MYTWSAPTRVFAIVLLVNVLVLMVMKVLLVKELYVQTNVLVMVYAVLLLIKLLLFQTMLTLPTIYGMVTRFKVVYVTQDTKVMTAVNVNAQVVTIH